MRTLIYILTMLLLASCYNDEENYEYREINAVDVAMDEVYTVRLDRDTIIELTPRLSQSLLKDEKNLKYTWIHGTINHNFYNLALVYGGPDTVGTEKTLRFHIDPDAEGLKYKHYFRVTVYDESTGLEYPVNTTIELTKPYDGAWMVLHAKDGRTELGSVEYIGGKTEVREDAYFQSSGKRFAGRPLCLGQFTTSVKYYGSGDDWNMFYVLTDVPTEAGVYCQWERFAKKDSLSRMVAPLARTGFDYGHVKLMDGDGSAGAVLLSEEGVFYQSPRAGKVYKPESDLEGEVKFTLASKVADRTLLYDAAGNRFAYYYNTSVASGTNYDPLYFNEAGENSERIKPIPPRDGNVTEVDPNQLPQEQKVLYVGTGYQFGQDVTDVYAYALAVSDDRCFVYEFNAKGLSSPSFVAFNAYYSIGLPKDLDENACFASTPPYSGILFYASGNTVYRLDFKQSGGRATPVYTHPGGKAVKMKFARKNASAKGSFKAYQFDVLRSLGISFDMGNGKSDFVILNLSGTGGIGPDSEDYPATQVYSDFGQIADFVFI